MDNPEKVEDRFLFHNNHGHTVRLGGDSKGAIKKWDPAEHDFVFSQEPMTSNRLFEVSLEWVDDNYEVTFFGVVTQHPIMFFPSGFDVSHPSALCLDCDGVWNFGTWRQDRRQFLRNLTPGSRVGLVLQEDRSLRVFLNGEDMGVVAVKVPDPCHFMVDMYARCNTIASQPIRVVDLL